MRPVFTLFVAGLFSLVLQAQSNPQPASAMQPDPPHRDWTAGWISHPTAPLRDPVVLHFRRTLTLEAVPESYVVRVSADHRFILFVNGHRVGDGPAREGLMRQVPNVHWRIANGDQELSRYFSALDVFVFPSLTDTFGLVMLEALASGVPVAAFPVPGPIDVLAGSAAGVLDPDLKKAALAALDIDPALCRDHALKFSWDHVTDQFLHLLKPHS